MTALVVLSVIVLGLAHWNTDEYALTPGDATPIAPLVKVDGVATNRHPDTIMLTDVYLTQLSALQWITTHFQSHVQYVPADELVEPGEPEAELNAQGYLEMRDAKQAAEVEAFRSLGWPVPGTPTGSIVNGVVDPSPAWSASLHVGDEIVGVDGTAIDSSCALVKFVHVLAPGTVLHLRVERVRISASGTLSWRAPSSLTLTTGAVPSGLASDGCAGVSGADRSWLGVSLEDDVAYKLPARVSIDTADIGGPSAGLAMTLALINKMSAGSLTGHHVVAATGTIAVGGSVGQVGGVAEKTVAVQRAGASYFLVPRAEAATARAAASPGLHVLGVRSLAQALRDLRKLGGVAPRALTAPS